MKTLKAILGKIIESAIFCGAFLILAVICAVAGPLLCWDELQQSKEREKRKQEEAE